MSGDIFHLLPALYRIRDGQLAAQMNLLTPVEVAEQAALATLTPPLSADDAARLAELNAKAARGPLESLLMVIGEQIEAVSYDLERLYDDQFIETCAPWVIPYIGDLIGYQTINGVSAAVDDPRAEVANTISMRRRKGTILVLEELAQDVTGWGAHAVEMFRTLGDTQYVKHVRPENHYALDFRDWRACFYVDTGFNTVSHRVDVRRIETRRGRWNVQNIGVFLWSLGAFGIEQAPLVSAPAVAGSGALCFRFHPLGIDAPLFHRANSQGDPILAAATPYNVPAALKRRPLCADMSRGVAGQFYGETGSLTLFVNGEPVDPWQIRVADLAGADGAWANATLPSPYLFAIDPELGRLVWQPPAPPLPPLTASWRYGANAAMGGGDYPRSGSFTVTDPAWVVPFPDPRFATLAAAVAYAEGLLAEEGSVAVEVAGDAPISLAAPLAMNLPAGATLELRAADGSRPALWLGGEISVFGGSLSTFILNGFLVAAGPAMSPAAWPASPAALVRVPALTPSGAANLLGALNFIDCTLTPGWSLKSDSTPVSPHAPSLIVEAPGVAASTLRAILGAVAAHPLASVGFKDSVVDATDRTIVAYSGLDGSSGGGALTAEGATLIGKVHASFISLASDCIFWSALAKGDVAPWVSGLVADRKQEGCVRFSFLPHGAVTPRRFECVELGLASPQPLFFTLRYGAPAYGKLITSTPDAVRRGAADGGEMGAYHFVQAVQRETDLTIRLTEYLPVGMEFGLIDQS
jgi:hypothetical protein